MNILVLAAHPDDEVLGCGGTIARAASEGHRVVIAILGQGAASRCNRSDSNSAKEVRLLEEASRKAARILGAAEIRHCGFPDNRFDSLDLLDIIKTIESLGQDVRPEMVYVQHGGDLNIDHAITFRAAMTAFRPLPGGSVQQLLAFEVVSSTEWAFSKFSPAFIPDTYVDVSAFIELKLAAMDAYEMEWRDYPHPRSPSALRMAASIRGCQVGLPAAEAFATVWRRV